MIPSAPLDVGEVDWAEVVDRVVSIQFTDWAGARSSGSATGRLLSVERSAATALITLRFEEGALLTNAVWSDPPVNFEPVHLGRVRIW